MHDTHCDYSNTYVAIIFGSPLAHHKCIVIIQGIMRTQSVQCLNNCVIDYCVIVEFAFQSTIVLSVHIGSYGWALVDTYMRKRGLGTAQNYYGYAQCLMYQI